MRFDQVDYFLTALFLDQAQEQQIIQWFRRWSMLNHLPNLGALPPHVPLASSPIPWKYQDILDRNIPKWPSQKLETVRIDNNQLNIEWGLKQEALVDFFLAIRKNLLISNVVAQEMVGTNLLLTQSEEFLSENMARFLTEPQIEIPQHSVGLVHLNMLRVSINKDQEYNWDIIYQRKISKQRQN